MFVTNRSPYRVVLARAALSKTEGCAAIVVESYYRVGTDGLVPLPASAREPRPTDPPDVTGHPVWWGVSITAAARVAPPERTSRWRVSLAVGQQAQELAIFGPRRWVRRGRELVPSDPGSFEPLELSYRQSFGGTYEMPPGLFPGTDLPHPGGTIAYALNPTGMGFFGEARAAEGQPLPRIERADQPIQRWEDRPRPGGLSPCPELMALRVQPPALAEPPADFEPDLGRMLRLLHHAEGELIFRDIPQGTMIELAGASGDPIRFIAPSSPVDVELLKAERGPAGALRALHIDANDRIVCAVHHHPFATRNRPRRITVRERQSARQGAA